MDGGSTWRDGSLVTKDVNGSPKIGFEVSEGTYHRGDILVKTTDIAGNIYERTMYISSRKPLVIDNTADDFTATLANDTGASSTDQISSNGQVNVSGIEDTSYWYYRIKIDGSWSSWSSHKESTDTSFTLSTGSYDDIEVKSIDVAGNEKVVSMGAAKIDSRVLSAPTIVAMDDNVNSAQYFRNTDDTTNSGFGDIITDDKSLRVKLTTSNTMEGDIVKLYVSNGQTEEVISHTVTAKEAALDYIYITLDEAKFPSDGTYTLATSITNSIGVTTTKSTPITLTIDTQADNISYSLEEDTTAPNVINGDTDLITSNGKIFISGIDDNSECIWRTAENTRWAKLITQKDANGNYYTVLSEGTYTNVEIKTYDANGIESNIITIAKIVIDQTGDELSDLSAEITNTLIAGGEKSSVDYTISGLDSDAKATLTFTDISGNTVIVSDVTSGGSADLSSFVPGEVSLSIRSIDTAGNTASGTATGSTLAPAVSLSLGTDTGTSDIDRITSDLTVNVSGLSAGDVWEYTLDGGSTWTSGIGMSFELADNTEYATGDVKVRLTDSAGNTSTTSLGSVVTDTVANTATLYLNNDTGIDGDNITTDPLVHVGNLETSTSWEYSLNGGLTWTRGRGTAFNLEPNKVYSQNAVQVKTSDAAGNTAISKLGEVTTSSSSEASGTSIPNGVEAISNIRIIDKLQLDREQSFKAKVDSKKLELTETSRLKTGSIDAYKLVPAHYTVSTDYTLPDSLKQSMFVDVEKLTQDVKKALRGNEVAEINSKNYTNTVKDGVQKQVLNEVAAKYISNPTGGTLADVLKLEFSNMEIDYNIGTGLKTAKYQDILSSVVRVENSEASNTHDITMFANQLRSFSSDIVTVKAEVDGHTTKIQETKQAFAGTMELWNNNNRLWFDYQNKPLNEDQAPIGVMKRSDTQDGPDDSGSEIYWTYGGVGIGWMRFDGKVAKDLEEVSQKLQKQIDGAIDTYLW